MVAATGTVGLLLMQDVSVRLIVVLVLFILVIFIAIALVWAAANLKRKLADRKAAALSAEMDAEEEPQGSALEIAQGPRDPSDED